MSHSINKNINCCGVRLFNALMLRFFLILILLLLLCESHALNKNTNCCGAKMVEKLDLLHFLNDTLICFHAPCSAFLIMISQIRHISYRAMWNSRMTIVWPL